MKVPRVTFVNFQGRETVLTLAEGDTWDARFPVTASMEGEQIRRTASVEIDWVEEPA